MITIPAKDWNSEKGKYEDTSLPEWKSYYEDLQAFEDYMQKIKPKPEQFGYESAGLENQGGWTIQGGEEAYGKALSRWEMARSMDAPNKPGYTRANND